MADREDTTMTEDEAAAALAPFLASARAEDTAPRTALINAILADAADVSSTRARPAPVPQRHRWRFPAPVGWRGATALAACVVAGFVIGLLGGGDDLGTAAVWGEATAVDPVAGFFDLDAAEG
jgi:hypothetical protein